MTGIADTPVQQARSGLRIAIRYVLMPLVLVAALGTVALWLLGAWSQHKALKEVLDEPAGVYPARTVVCRGAVEIGCAEKAAQRAERSVAWVRSGPSLETPAFVVARTDGQTGPLPAGRIFEEVRYKDVLASILTEPVPADDRWAGSARPVRSGHAAGTLYDEGESGVTLEWTRDGQSYRIDAVAIGERDEAATAAVEIFKRVQYSSP